MNFKKTMIALAALLAATTAHAGWWRTYGDEGSDGGHCVQITSDGNYIISGNRDDSLWLLKVDTSGTVLWSKTYIGTGSWRGRWIEETSDGSYIVACRTPSLLKVSAQGDSLWARNYEMQSYCVQPTSDGGYIVVGGDQGGESDSYLILVKTDSNGDTVWTRTYGDGVDNFYAGFFIQETFGGGYIISGLKWIEIGELWSVGLLLFKTDSLGDSLWTRTYGTTVPSEFSNAKGYCVRQTTDSGYVVVGYKAFEYDPEYGLWLLRTDPQGDTIWTKTYKAPDGGTGYNVQITQDGGYVMVGTTETLLASSATLANRNLWLLKTDSVGDTLWSRIYGGDEYDVARCVLQTEDEGYLVTGYTTSFGIGGSADLWLLKTDSLGLLVISEEPALKSSQNCYLISTLGPQIVLSYKDRQQGLNADIFDATGRKVDELHVLESSGTIFWGASHPTGVYFIQVKGTNHISTARAVLIR